MSPGTINIAVLHGLAAQGDALCDFIADSVGFRVTGSARDAAALDALLRSVRTHVLLVDLESVAGDAVALLAAARAAAPGVGILLQVQGQPQAQIDELLDKGAGGFVESGQPPDLVAALRTIALGRRWQPPAHVAAA